jgi:DNA-binding IclR family transcriptional regulator
VLWKAFDVLGAFSHRRRVLTLSEIARYSGLPKSTAHRVLFMLIEVGAVEQVPGGYQVGLRMFSLGVLPPEAALREAALPHLEELHRVTGHTLHLAILRGADVVYLEKLLPRGTSVVMPSVIGDRLPATVTGVGKVLLAFSSPEECAAALAGPLPRRTARSLGTLEALERELDAIRERGYALDREEATVGVSCVAVPILTGAGGSGGSRRAIAAISVSYPASSGSGEALIAPLHETAAAIARSSVLRRALLPRESSVPAIGMIRCGYGLSSMKLGRYIDERIDPHGRGLGGQGCQCAARRV